MRRLAIVALMLGSVIGLPASATAATSFTYIGFAGGTMVKAIGTTISSDLTAQSAIYGPVLPKQMTNNVTAVNVAQGLVTVGAVQTRTTAQAFGDGVKLTSYARTTGVSLLNGAITADAVETTTVSTSNTSGTSSSASTKFVGLKIINVNLPVTIPKNYTVTIPGLATVILNAAQPSASGMSIANIGYGLGVGLLKATNNAPLGSSIILNPTYAAVAASDPALAPILGGYGLGTRVQAQAGTVLSAEMGPSAFQGTPTNGSQGNTLSNSTATLNIPGLLTTSAVKSTSTSNAVGLDADVVTTNQLAKLNLLGGLITADAIKVTSHSKRVNGVYSGDMAMTLLNLVVAGNVIPANVPPNTKIEVAGLGTVTINQQAQTALSNQIRGVHIKLSTAQAGLPVGAEIEIGTAASWISG